jgi:hypothetical protein
MRAAFIFSICWLFVMATTATAQLPPRTMNVVPWGEGDDRHWTIDTAYLSDGWTPENFRARLGEFGIDTLRVAWSNETLSRGVESRWFNDIDELSRAGFKLVITCHTHLPDSGGRFSPYASKTEGHLPIDQRTPDAAPTWNTFIQNWQLIGEHFRNDPNVIGYEPFNEYAPSGKEIGPGRLLMRDFGGWIDAMADVSVGAGKHVWIEAPWATTTFSTLRGHRDDRGRLLKEIVAAHPGLIRPAIHVYHWYGKGFRRPESVEEVRRHLADPTLPADLKGPLQQIADEADPQLQIRRLHQFNFDQRFDSTRRLIADARDVCGLTDADQVWMSEAGLATGSFSGDESLDSTSATQFRAVVRACNAGNTSIAFWLDRGKPDAWGFFSRNEADPTSPKRQEMRRAFLDRESARADFISHADPFRVQGKPDAE